MPSKVKQGINDFVTWCKANNWEDLLDEWSAENGELKSLNVKKQIINNANNINWFTIKLNKLGRGNYENWRFKKSDNN